VPVGGSGSDGFGGEIMDGCQRRSPEEAMEAIGGHAIQQRRGRAHVRRAGEQDIEDDVGVEEHPHRCFSMRCAR
jgi:hypothetical protein